jgi:hypothetical protein
LADVVQQQTSDKQKKDIKENSRILKMVGRVCYRLIHKHMRQPHLMKFSKAHINKNSLSSDLMSIPLPLLTS